MKLPTPLYPGRLLRRYKRFLADVDLDSGETVTAHCPNSGSMKGCAIPGARVLLSISGAPKRKFPYTWELAQADGIWIGINTSRTNRLVQEAIRQEKIPELAGYTDIRPEVRYGAGSRIDLLLSGPSGDCYVEAKNVTLAEGKRALFPDAVTTRGQKHLHELMEVARSGGRGVIFFVVQREDTRDFSPADTIDPEYGSLLRIAVKRGVEALVYQAAVSPLEIILTKRLPMALD